MTEPAVTPRTGMPMLAVAQAQKEVTHNEALILADALLQPQVVEAPRADPPVAPLAGQCWLVGAAATGEWAGHGGALALWSEGGWRFVAPFAAMRVWCLADSAFWRFDGVEWRKSPAVAAPAGGANVDSEARTAIAALIDALIGQGMLIPV